MLFVHRRNKYLYTTAFYVILKLIYIVYRLKSQANYSQVRRKINLKINL